MTKSNVHSQKNSTGQTQAKRPDVRVKTKLPIHVKNPAKNALKGKLPTKRAYTNCSAAVIKAVAAKASRTCKPILPSQ